MELSIVLALSIPVMAAVGCIAGLVALGRIRKLERELNALRRGRADDEAERDAPREPSPEPTPSEETEQAPREPRAQPARPDFERAFAQSWMVWIGGAILAAGGLFFANWAAEQGYFGPIVRISAALALGAALTGAGEILARRRKEGDRVPGALAAAGLVTLYGAILAAHALYALFGAAIAMIALGAVCLYALTVGLSHGWVTPLAGAIGGYLAPIVVDSPEPSAWGLIGFLLAIGAITLVQAGAHRRVWLGWCVVLGALLWTGPIASGLLADLAPAGAFLLGHAALGLIASPLAETDAPHWRRPEAALIAIAAIAALGLAEIHGQADLALAIFVLAIAAAIVAALRWPTLIGLAWLAFALALLRTLAWRIGLVEFGQDVLGDPFTGLSARRWLPEALEPLFAACFVFGAGFFAIGFAQLARRAAAGPPPARAGHWASMAAAAPVLAIAVAHGRTAGFGVDLFTSAIALAIAGGLLGATSWLQRRNALDEAPLGALATGVAAALAAALSMALSAGWLTSALALLAAAIAWIDGQLRLRALSWFGAAICAVITLRAGLLFDFGGRPPGGVVEPITFYLAPIAALIVGRKLERGRGEARLRASLEIAALALWLALLIEIARALGRAGEPPFAAELLASASLTCGLLLTALAMARRADREASGPIARWSWPALAMGGLAALAVSALDRNPLFTGRALGPVPILDVALPAYLLPALLLFALAALLARRPRAAAPAPIARAATGAGAAAAMLWLFVEVRRAFQGARIAEPSSEAERLAHSASWLALAAASFAIGVLRDARRPRQAALALAACAALKAVLYDLAHLTGLYRALSLIGLGLALIALGWAYRRFVAPIAPLDRSTEGLQSNRV